MHISPVGSFSLVKRNAAVLKPKLNENKNVNCSFQTNLSFKGINPTDSKNSKDGIFKKIIGLFSTPVSKSNEEVQEVSPEEETDNDIKDTLRGLYNIYKSYSNLGKTDYAALKQMNKLGAKFDYRGYIPYGENKRLLFGDFSEETKRPGRVDIVSFTNGMHIETSYKFSGDFKTLTVITRENPNSSVRIDYVNKKVILMTDYDKEAKVLQRTLFLKNGVFYTYETINDRGEPDKIATVINYIFDDAKSSYCIDLEDDGSYGYFEFNTSKKMWEKTKSLSSEEVQDYL